MKRSRVVPLVVVLLVASSAGGSPVAGPVTVIAGQVTTTTAVLRELAGTVVVQNSPGTVRTNPKDGLRYVWIPAGTFVMGCSPGDSGCAKSEKPAHQVTITRGFWLGQTEVTVGACKRFSAGRRLPPAPKFNRGWVNDSMPIVNLFWQDAQDYCAWAGGRLPTEAEWEYAARAGSTEARYGPIDEIAWYRDNSGRQPHDVAQKRPNAWNLYDMLGNVWELVNDWYGEKYYSASPERDPPGPKSGESRVFLSNDRVMRGGAGSSDPWGVRVSNRFSFSPVEGYNSVGFRCAQETDIR